MDFFSDSGVRNSQGGVRFPTGGKLKYKQARERLSRGRVSRTSEILVPTVIVRTKENAITKESNHSVWISAP